MACQCAKPVSSLEFPETRPPNGSASLKWLSPNNLFGRARPVCWTRTRSNLSLGSKPTATVTSASDVGSRPCLRLCAPWATAVVLRRCTGLPGAGSLSKAMRPRTWGLCRCTLSWARPSSLTGAVSTPSLEGCAADWRWRTSNWPPVGRSYWWPTSRKPIAV